jgi:phosphoglycerol transferase MdoB-like AlkP superfamily enzyme
MFLTNVAPDRPTDCMESSPSVNGRTSSALAIPDTRPEAAAIVRVTGWLLERRHGGAGIVVLAMLGIGLATRLTLALMSLHELTWGGSLLAALGWGVVFDLGAALLTVVPLVLLLATVPRRFFVRRRGRLAAHAGVFAVLWILLFAGVAEWLFWEEFDARFNFIAVDYLVYTTEVIGNIRESYALPWIFGGVTAGAALFYGLTRRTGVLGRWLDHADEPVGVRWKAASLWLGAAMLAGGVLSETTLPAFANNYNRELAKNGVWSFFAAFRANEIDYQQFYPTIPVETAFRRVRGLIGVDAAQSPSAAADFDLLRVVHGAGPERRLNIIQITVESLSADFLGRYGSTAGITPNLDALVPQALVFDRFYATGTRTDRGMEALTLSVPPTPGRSLVKRPRNERLFTLGSVFRSRGYDTVFLYGGYGYFDNMNAFFGGNGYRVVDRACVGGDDVSFANAWGACDGDLLRWTLREADAASAAGKPFFHFVMTTSNHRPYTFPDGAIDLPSKTAGRAGGVKYTDHAIGEFLRAAAERPWFRDTIFVIVADHCASSAGRAELPVDRYHIPLIIYAPGGQVEPGVVETLASQIDYPPTLLGLLGWTYSSRFFGRDVLAAGAKDYPGRALIGTYQHLGLYVEGGGANLAELKPVRETVAFHFDSSTNQAVESAADPDLLTDAIAYYQTASFLFSHGRQSEIASAAP